MNTWIVGKHLMKHHFLTKTFYSNLNMEDITDLNHRHAIRVFKSLNNKNLGDYQYCLKMFLKILEACVLKYMTLILIIFYRPQD